MISPTLHDPSTNHTHVSYVGTILTMAMIVRHGSRFYSIDLQEDLNQQRWEESKNELLNMMRSFCEMEYSIPLNKMPQILWSIALAPVSSIVEPEDSLNIGDEHLSTIPKKESDEVIKSSVENLVPISSEFEDTSESDSECDDFSSIDVPLGDSVTFSNPLFDSNDEFTSSNDESLPDE
ncbi:hypothetical protein Tco_0332899 [Tanacetum coccineum]